MSQLAGFYWNGGQHPPLGWTGSPGDAAQLVAEGLDEPTGGRDRVYVGPALVRIERWEVVDVLTEFRRVLRPGGRIRAAVYDVEVAVDAWRRDDLDFFWDQDEGLDAAFTVQVLDHGTARSLFTGPLLVAALEAAGFADARVRAPGETGDPEHRLADPDEFVDHCCFAEARNPAAWHRSWPTAEPVGVHLGWADPAGRRFVVGWTAPPQPRCSLTYRPVGQGRWADTVVVTEDLPGGAADRVAHRALTGELTPGQTYEYRIERSDGGTCFESTLAAPPGDPGAEVRLGFVADTGVAGRADGLADGVDGVLAALDRHDPDVVLAGGDYAYRSSDRRWATPQQGVVSWLAQMEPIASRRPLMVQYGNHEVGLGERHRDWRVHFPPPREGQVAEGVRSFSFDIGACHVVGFYAPTADLDPREVAWLCDDLARARCRQGWLVVFQHQPLIAHGSSHPAEPAVARTLGPLLTTYGVDLHLSAHDQSYERTHPLVWDDAGPRVASTARTTRRGTGTVLAKVSPSGKRSDRGRDFSALPVERSPLVAATDDRAHHLALIRADRDRLELTVLAVAPGSGDEREIDRVVIES